MNYTLIVKTENGTKMYDNYRLYGYRAKCTECNFHKFAFEWTDDVKEEVIIHNEKHRMEITIEFRDDRL